ncbi:hypothetical protein M231_04296 [Tremella mesenterica]|uniref:Uncharacterized protein n=1 Tax=Tremella mesenterica TaxID=5217 RepID=A0A4V1M3X5_TREME|nr:hypothetical protein M231_04296 [Tremella mesenterica]
MDKFGPYGSGPYRVYTSQLTGSTPDRTQRYHRTGAISVTGDRNEEQESDKETQAGKDLPPSSNERKGKKKSFKSHQKTLQTQQESGPYDEVEDDGESSLGDVGYIYGADLSESERRLRDSMEVDTEDGMSKTEGKKKNDTNAKVMMANSSWEANYSGVESKGEREITLTGKYVRFSEPSNTQPNDLQAQYLVDESHGRNDDEDVEMTDDG